MKTLVAKDHAVQVSSLELLFVTSQFSIGYGPITILSEFAFVPLVICNSRSPNMISKRIDFPSLTADNYASWAIQMHTLLVLDDLWDIINPAFAIPLPAP
jgi:hypothetical protein